MGKLLTDIGQSNVEVAGRPGIAFGFKGMGEKTAASDKVYDEAMDEIKKTRPQTKGGAYIFDKATGDYLDPWVLVKTSKAKWDKLTHDQKMEKVADQMEDYWKLFNTVMEKKKGFLKSGQEIEKIISK